MWQKLGAFMVNKYTKINIQSQAKKFKYFLGKEATKSNDFSVR
jgi:hypothetical protein